MGFENNVNSVKIQSLGKKITSLPAVATPHVSPDGQKGALSSCSQQGANTKAEHLSAVPMLASVDELLV